MFSIEEQIKIWKRVTALPALLQAVANINESEVSEISKLRKMWSAVEVRFAIELVNARKSAAKRLDNAASIVSDVEGVQQSSSSAIAKWKAKRFAHCSPVVDLCCGIGGDLLYLPDHAIGVDVDPLRCWMAKQNTGKKIVCEDARTFSELKNASILLDPSRRDSKGRRLDVEQMLPNISEVETICSRVKGGCVKLSPAINLEEIAGIGKKREVEYIEDRGKVTQGIVWFDSLAAKNVETTASSITSGKTISGVIQTPRVFGEIGPWLFEPNPALERAKLHGTLGCELELWEPAFGLGLLCGNKKIQSTWFTSFEVLETTSLRLEKVAASLRNQHAGEVEVKTRGGVVDPNIWQIKLQKPASDSTKRLTVFALRLGKKRIALITRRVTQ